MSLIWNTPFPGWRSLLGWGLTRDRFVLASWPPEAGQAEIDRQETEMTKNDAANELESWWLKLAQDQVQRTVPKALDYGSDDLRDLGAWLADSMGIEGADEGTLVQLGIVMYIRGKLARVTSAIKDGRKPSEDTWFDLGVYSVMGLRAREFGAWPGADLEADLNYQNATDEQHNRTVK